MNVKALVFSWFEKWEEGDFHHLPITKDFKHTSPYGTIKGKEAYINLVDQNKDKFLDHRFDIHDGIYDTNKACVRYTAVQGDFNLDISEWYFIKDNLIDEIISYYHIGEIRKDRQLKRSS